MHSWRERFQRSRESAGTRLSPLRKPLIWVWTGKAAFSLPTAEAVDIIAKFFSATVCKWLGRLFLTTGLNCALGVFLNTLFLFTLAAVYSLPPAHHAAPYLQAVTLLSFGSLCKGVDRPCYCVKYTDNTFMPGPLSTAWQSHSFSFSPQKLTLPGTLLGLHQAIESCHTITIIQYI